MWRRCAVFILTLIARCGGTVAQDAPDQPALSAPVQCGTLPKTINESSGLVKSLRFADKDVFWTHNDSGDTARIFAVHSDGSLIREVAIEKAKNRDWEELTMDPQGRLVACDIGDNHRKHKSFTLYRFAEPDAFAARDEPVVAEAFHFRYPDVNGPTDAEALVIRGGNAYLFTKELNGTRVYKLPLPEHAPEQSESVEAQSIAFTKNFSIATGAAITADGRHLAVISYLAVMVLDLPEALENLKEDAEHQLPIFDAPKRVRAMFLGQSEAVAWDGKSLVITTEGRKVFRSEHALK